MAETRETRECAHCGATQVYRRRRTGKGWAWSCTSCGRTGHQAAAPAAPSPEVEHG